MEGNFVLTRDVIENVNSVMLLKKLKALPLEAIIDEDTKANDNFVFVIDIARQTRSDFEIIPSKEVTYSGGDRKQVRFLLTSEFCKEYTTIRYRGIDFDMYYQPLTQN